MKKFTQWLENFANPIHQILANFMDIHYRGEYHKEKNIYFITKYLDQNGQGDGYIGITEETNKGDLYVTASSYAISKTFSIYGLPQLLEAMKETHAAIYFSIASFSRKVNNPLPPEWIALLKQKGYVLNQQLNNWSFPKTE